jgi:hypothetical protein
MLTSSSDKIFGLTDSIRRVAGGEYNRQTEESLEHRYPYIHGTIFSEDSMTFVRVCAVTSCAICCFVFYFARRTGYR